MTSDDQNQDSLRIAVISSGPDEFATIHAACTQAGHLPVAYLYGRSLRSGGPTFPDAGETTTAILSALPPSMDLTLPGNMAGLARALESYRVDLLIVFGFAWKLPTSVLAIPRLGAINIHVSMLPQYRGPAPLLWAIRNGDRTGGVTVHWMDEGFDTGNVLAQQDGIPLADGITWAAYCDEAMPVVHSLLTKSQPWPPQAIAAHHKITAQRPTPASWKTSSPSSIGPKAPSRSTTRSGLSATCAREQPPLPKWAPTACI